MILQELKNIDFLQVLGGGSNYCRSTTVAALALSTVKKSPALTVAICVQRTISGPAVLPVAGLTRVAATVYSYRPWSDKTV
jgi:hypothetical protein